VVQCSNLDGDIRCSASQFLGVSLEYHLQRLQSPRLVPVVLRGSRYDRLCTAVDKRLS